MRLETQKRRSGFTLIELMIVVAIIGVLASVAIPSFLNYQLTAKRAEAYTNLSALAKSQKAYFAEFNEYHPAAPEPGASTGEAPTTTKRPVEDLATEFGPVGFTPEGDVFFDYDSIVEGFAGCTCVGCFTATAYGNLDGDNLMSEIVYFHPDAAGAWCPVGVGGHGPPTDPKTGAIQWDMVVRHPSSDIF
jgi:prepilin-type N-terminal cleavage/methylation domain-containing protein